MNELVEKNNSFSRNLNESNNLVITRDYGFDCASFFSMHKTPFTLTPPKNHIFEHENYLHAKNTLLFGISSGEKLLKITGEVGAGKTLLINDTLSSIDHQHYPIRILNPKISPKDLLCQIIDEFGRPYPADATIEQLMRVLRFTLHEHYTRTDANILVWIDDAQNLSNNTLLIIDKISSWSTPNRALLQFIISGSIELDQRLEHPLLSSMKNNIRFSDILINIKKHELSDYVSSCIHSEDELDKPQFIPRALKQLYKYSNGNPSAINKLAYKSLLLAYGKGLRTVTHHYVNAAFREQYDAQNHVHQYLQNKVKTKSQQSSGKLYTKKHWLHASVAWLSINAVLAYAYFGGYL